MTARTATAAAAAAGTAITAVADAADVAIAGAYSATAARWRDGPAAVYNRLAEVLVEQSPVSMRDASVIDIGAGTGAASFAALAAGAGSVLAVDAAAGMLAVDADRRPASIVADATRLPCAPDSFDIALAAFSFNHLSDPAAGFLEAARVVRPGGAVVASAYASDDQHPVKVAVERALRSRGWMPQPWQTEIYRSRAPLLATAEACAIVMQRVGRRATIVHHRVSFADLAPRQWVAWRLGMAQHAPFVGSLTRLEQQVVVHEAIEELGDDAPPLVRSIMVVVMEC